MATDMERRLEALDIAWNYVEQARAQYGRALDALGDLPVKLDTAELQSVREELTRTELTFGLDQQIIATYRKEMHNATDPDA